MTLMLPVLPEPLTFAENQVQYLIIENPSALRETLTDLFELSAGQTGACVLSEDFVPIDFAGNTALILDPFHLEFETKKLLGKIAAEAAAAAEPQGDRIMRLIHEINQLAADLCLAFDFDAVFTELERPEDLIRMMGFRPDGKDLPFAERLLTWMRLQRRFLGKRLFILYGLSAFLDAEELSSFYRSVFYEKLELLLIEPFQFRPPLAEEQVTIIDKDLCMIR